MYDSESLWDTPEARRDEGMRRAKSAAPRGWMEAAEKAVDLLSRGGRQFTSDDLWAILDAPPEPRALGPLLRRLASEGRIEKQGYRQSKRRERHCGPVAVWRGVV